MNIKSKHELNAIIRYEKKLYPNTFLDCLTNDQRVYNWRFMRLLRYSEYYGRRKQSNLLFLILWLFFRRKRNTLGCKIGVQIQEGSFDKGLVIHHNGSIVVSGGARVGMNCQLHGDNCIGNIGKSGQEGCPVIGDNVSIGVGAKILGPITIASNVIIGANAVVISSCYESGISLVGVPAKKVLPIRNEAQQDDIPID